MHELNICFDIIKVLESRVQKKQAFFIKTLWLEVGQLCSIETEALRFSFPIAAKSTIAQKAKLEIISTPGRAFCNLCQKDISIDFLFDACAYCQQYDYQITAGKELRIIKMEEYI